MVDLSPESPAPPEKMLTLPEGFESALLGHTLDPLGGTPKWVYSLEKMAVVVQGSAAGHGQTIDLDTARTRVWELVEEIARTYGSRTPLFVFSQAEVPQGPKLWTPGQ